MDIQKVYNDIVDTCTISPEEIKEIYNSNELSNLPSEEKILSTLTYASFQYTNRVLRCLLEKLDEIN
ncbi:hypothetical protein [Finegoldia magna]|uniref:hypothetical protein n=1 Tax=Finegoldia magna TaxID=1260 RepID=UPI000B9190B6|nr:hypothetical protein [Finegoldia magna]OXZ40012.1 hypothetical protein B9N50_00210 [Finegoldia magna]